MAESMAFNMRNPAVKRILREVEEMRRDPSKEFLSMPIEEDLFEWQFAIHGPPDTEFEGGIYHGRIILPSEYPFKPPAFMLLTPSGRFEVQTKICLSISQHHPEHWQPSWSVRTALVALIAFMPTKADGAIGSLEYTPEERRLLAIKSRQSPPKFGSFERQKVIGLIHERMLANAPPVPELRNKPIVVDPVDKPVSDSATIPDAELTPSSKPVSVGQNVSETDAVDNEQSEITYGSYETSSLSSSYSTLEARENEKNLSSTHEQISSNGVSNDDEKQFSPPTSHDDGVRNCTVIKDGEHASSSVLRKRAVGVARENSGELSRGQGQSQTPSLNHVFADSTRVVRGNSNSLEALVLNVLTVAISLALFVLILKKILNSYDVNTLNFH